MRARRSICEALLLPALLIPKALPAQDAAPRSVFVTLGTNGGPTPNPIRAEPANLLLSGDTAILIDAGDGASDQIGKAGLTLGQIHTVLLTHLHYDHTGGLFALLGRRYQVSEPGVVTIYGPIGTRRLVNGLVAAMQPESESGIGYVGEPTRPPARGIRVIERGDGDTWTIGNIRITAAVNTHYSFPPGSREAARYQSLSYRFDLPDRSVVLTGDTGPSRNVEQLARDADLLVSEIIAPDAQIAAFKRRHPDAAPSFLATIDLHFRQQHLTADQVGMLAGQAHVRRVVITHNALGTGDPAAALTSIVGHFAGPVTIANDLDRF